METNEHYITMLHAIFMHACVGFQTVNPTVTIIVARYNTQKKASCQVSMLYVYQLFINASAFGHM